MPALLSAHGAKSMDGPLESKGIRVSVHLNRAPPIQDDPDATLGHLGSTDKTDEPTALRIATEAAASSINTLEIDILLLAERDSK
jgi:hypothetical protein